MSTAITDEPRLLWPAGAELGEGPLWDGREGWVYWLDIEGRRLHRADAAGGLRRSWTLPERIGLAALTKEPGQLLLGLQSGLHLFRPDASSPDAAEGLRFLLRPESQEMEARPNDGKVDAVGRLWFGTMALSQREGGGALHCLDRGGRCRRFAQGWTIPNGPAITPDGRKLYWADSHRRCIFTLDVGVNGEPGEPQLFLHLPEANRGVPDGMALDSEGCLWVALNGGGCVRRFGPDGQALEEIRFATPAVSSCAFGDEGLETLFVTTARQGAGPARQAEASGALFAVPTRVHGIPAGAFSLRGP